MIKKLNILFFLNIFLLYLTQTKPPESYSLIRGVNENINLHSGTVNLEVPLFEITEGKFKLGNSLSYESRGFVPHMMPSYVGLNWNMQQFGKITREQHRIDPTVLNILRLAPLTGSVINWNLTSVPYRLNDCIFSSFGQNIYKKNILNDPANTSYKSQTIGAGGEIYLSHYKDYEPDKFYFDFLGYKGYFIIDNEGKPIVYSENASLKISIDSKCYNIFENVAASQIIIQDDKGNQYFFGGGLNELDINFSQSYLNYSNNDYIGVGNEIKRTNYIDSWLLKKVILNDGTVINGFYKVSNHSILNNFRGNGNSAYTFEPSGDIGSNFPTKVDLNINNLNIKHSRIYGRTVSFVGSSGIYTNVNTQLDTYTKEAMLDSITINDVTVHYSYIDTQNPLELTNKYLSEIKIKRKNKLIKKINLNYEDYGSTNKRTFLNNVTSNVGENVYFEYYNTTKFPPYNEFLTNDLGYWNGVMTYDASNYDIMLYTPLSEDQSVYDTGMLKTVTFPTKGTSTFFYEHGDFSKEYNIDFNTRKPVLFNNNGTTNSPRLYKKIENDLSGNNIETLYTYKNDDNTSSGILDGKVTKTYIQGIDMQSFKNLATNLYSQNSLHYSNVKEIVTNKGFKNYKFSDRITNPDSLASKVYPGSHFSIYGWESWDEIDRKYLSKANERGKILREEIYNKDNIKVKEIIYKYSNFLSKLPNLDLVQNCAGCKVSDLNYYVYTSDHNSAFVQSMYVPVIPYLLSSKITREYFGNKVVETVNNISYLDKILKKYNEGSSTSKDYTWYPYPKEIMHNTILGTSINRYLYPIDLYNENPCVSCNDNITIVGGQNVTYQQLHYKNVFTPVVEIAKNNDNKFLLKENIFSPTTSLVSGAYAIKKTRNSLLNSTFDFNSYKIPVSQTEDNSIFDLYDNKVNLIQQTSKSGIPTTTIWGYNQTLPIATIEGATYLQVMQAFGLNSGDNNSYLQLAIVDKSNLDIDNNSESTLISELNTFRNKSELKDFKISTYTYNPLIGITSITPPSGIRENYIYDSSNRLEKIVDINNNIVKEFTFNYTPKKYYNIQKSQAFTKENCGPSTLTEPLVYKIPSGKYTSEISQADADQKAQNDINANGQAYANTNGVCKPYVCSVTPSYNVSIYYSAFQETSANHIKAIISIPVNDPNLHWSGGVFIGTLQDLCRPNSYKNISINGWSISIAPSGGVTLYSSGSSSGSVATLNFEYDK
ncbi:DUF5977 domain-containing protein [Chryseobacterium fluminis]|uniref:DUF5977 domain-containing protein n=1 Tax=Chryseobacterium fluminis TaxID=2983606 RepID=UPI00225568A5|nr:DUF5977 domain-containing protein [Chryseobacterium sp. MMS21-Ot14]UZT96601.1 DUF5977 domain-containing protein [Chryseobacterium sp. MMS21-Ot14]